MKLEVYIAFKYRFLTAYKNKNEVKIDMTHNNPLTSAINSKPLKFPAKARGKKKVISMNIRTEYAA